MAIMPELMHFDGACPFLFCLETGPHSHEIKREQLKAYNKFLQNLQEEAEEAVEQVNRVFNKYFPDFQLSNDFRNNSLKRFLRHLPSARLCEAMEKACSQFSDMGTNWWVTRRAIKYFCGICWNWIKNPDSTDW